MVTINTNYQNIKNEAEKLLPQIEIASLMLLTDNQKLQAIGVILGVSLIVTSIKRLLKPINLKRNNPYIGNQIETENGLAIPNFNETYETLFRELNNNKKISSEDKELFRLIGTYIKDWEPIINYQQLFELFSRVKVNYIKPNSDYYARHKNYTLEIPVKETFPNKRMLKLHEMMHGVICIPDYPCLDEGINVLVISQYWNNGMPTYNYNYSTMITSLIGFLIGPEYLICSANSWKNDIIIERLTEITNSKEETLHLLELTTKYYETYKKANLSAIKARTKKTEPRSDEETRNLLASLSDIRVEFTKNFKRLADIQIEKGIIPEDSFDYSKGYVILNRPYTFYKGNEIYINGRLRNNFDTTKYYELINKFNNDSRVVHKILESLSPEIDFDIISDKGIVVRETEKDKLMMLSKDELKYIVGNSEEQELELEELVSLITSERRRIQEKRLTCHKRYTNNNQTTFLNPEISKVMEYLEIDEEKAASFITKLNSTTCFYKNNQGIEIKTTEFDGDGMLYVATTSCSVNELQIYVDFVTSIEGLQSIDSSMMMETIKGIKNSTFDNDKETSNYLRGNILLKEIK